MPPDQPVGRSALGSDRAHQGMQSDITAVF
jgi:hypothetical protein